MISSNKSLHRIIDVKTHKTLRDLEVEGIYFEKGQVIGILDSDILITYKIIEIIPIILKYNIILNQIFVDIDANSYHKFFKSDV